MFFIICRDAGSLALDQKSFFNVGLVDKSSSNDFVPGERAQFALPLT
jgi:hypothetical protein